MKHNTPRNLVLAALALSAASSGFAEAFSFGVMGDTQDTAGVGINSVAINQINACNNAFVQAGVKFVVQVGDLGDNGSVASLQTRLAANTALTNAGITFYGLRGNHEDNSAAQAYFNANYIPTGANVGADGSSYAVTYGNTKIVLLDILSADSATTMTNDTTWMANQLKATDHTQAFVFDHKNLLGQSHKDNAFGSSNDANPTQQNAFFAAAAGNGVKYVISGHDHMDYSSVVTSPDGSNKLQEIITASDSTKYYTPGAPFSSRDTPVAQQLNSTGYYIYTVDGPRVTAKFYATTPLGNGDVPANATFTLQDTFGYSLNGKENLVAQGGSYVTSHTIAAGLNTTFNETYRGTTMAILSGTNGSTANTADGRALTKNVSIGWAPSTNGPASAGSDVLILMGMTELGKGDKTDTFALALSFDPTGLSLADLNAGKYGILSKDAAGTWTNTVDLNFGGTKSFVFGAYNAGAALGTYGIDLSTDTAWAVVNHNSEFVLAAIPEPSTYAAICGALTLGFVAFRRRRTDLC